MTKLPPPASRLPVWREVPLLLRRAARELAAHDPLRLGAATAFFTAFALPPIFIVLVQLLRGLYPSSLVRALLLDKLGAVLGPAATALVALVVANVADARRAAWATALGFGFLVFVATTLFTVIQHSLNQIWQVRARRDASTVGQALRERLRSGGLLLATAALAVLAFVTDAALSGFAQLIADFDTTAVYYLVRGLNALLGYLILAVWCGYTFRLLSLAKVPWRAVVRGAGLTALLMTGGKAALGYLLVAQDLGPVYGPASGLVLVLLFVFYCAMIFYYGAAFTKAYAHHIGLDLKPKKTAVRYRLVNVVEE